MEGSIFMMTDEGKFEFNKTYYAQLSEEDKQKERERLTAYRVANIDTVRERDRVWHAKYRAENIDKVREQERIRSAKYRAANADKEKERKAEYNAEHADEQKEWRTEYRAANIEKITAYKTEHHECACGGHYSTQHKSRHNTSKKHLKYFAELN